MKVVVLGAAGGIGQPLSLLLKLSPHVTQLALYDVVHAPGVGADLAHIDTNTHVSAYIGEDQLPLALADADCVLVPAGVARKPGMTRGDLFNINASICASLALAIATHCPNALTMVISNPVNSTTAIFKQIFIKQGTYNPHKLLGVTNLDHVRANCFVAEQTKTPAQQLNVVVVGGHSGHSIVPLVSQYNFPDEVREALVKRVQYGGDEVVAAKQGSGSATLSMAYAALNFFNNVVTGQTASAYVDISMGIPGSDVLEKFLREKVGMEEVPKFFSTPVQFEDLSVLKIDTEWTKTCDKAELNSIAVACEFVHENIAKAATF